MSDLTRDKRMGVREILAAWAIIVILLAGLGGVETAHRTLAEPAAAALAAITGTEAEPPC